MPLRAALVWSCWILCDPAFFYPGSVLADYVIKNGFFKSTTFWLDAKR